MDKSTAPIYRIVDLPACNCATGRVRYRTVTTVLEYRRGVGRRRVDYRYFDYSGTCTLCICIQVRGSVGYIVASSCAPLLPARRRDGDLHGGTFAVALAAAAGQSFTALAFQPESCAAAEAAWCWCHEYPAA